MATTLRLATICIAVCYVFGSAVCFADDFAEVVHNTRALMHHRIIELKGGKHSYINNDLEMEHSIQMSICRNGEFVLVDTATTAEPRKDKNTGKQFGRSTSHEQRLINTKQNALTIRYSVDMAKRKVKDVIVAHPELQMLQKHVRIYATTGLNEVFAEFNYSGHDLLSLYEAIMRGDSVGVEFSEELVNGESVFTFDSVGTHGTSKIYTKRIRSKCYIDKIEINKAIGDYIFGKDSKKLGQYTSNLYGNTPVNTTRKTLQINYGDNGSGAIVSGYQVVRSDNSDSVELRIVESYKVMSTKSFTSSDDLNGVTIDDLDGDEVYLLNGQLSDIKLVYRDGEIVRAVDGASLEQVVIEVENKKRLWLVLKIVGAVLAVGLVGYFGYRFWNQRRGNRGAKA